MPMYLKTAFFLCLILISISGYSTERATFQAASVEFNPDFLAFDSNLPKLKAAAESALKNNAKLVVLPEMATVGYIYKDRNQIQPYLDTIPGKTTRILAPLAKRYQAYIAVGIAEEDPVSHLAYNAAALIGPNGYIGKYRKNNLNPDDQKWASRGNLGFPVFNTALGKISLVICYDDTYVSSLVLPALRGANIIAYLTASDRLPLQESGSQFNHSTIANIATLSGWTGTYIVASSRTGLEYNPLTQRSTNYVGGASIWDPNGRNLAQAPASPLDHPLPPSTIHAIIDPALYNNPAKRVLQERRRPELYGLMNLYRAPIDSKASTKAYTITAIAVQYTPKIGDYAQNLKSVSNLLKNSHLENPSLILLPENSFLGSTDMKDLRMLAEPLQGKTFNDCSHLAKMYHSYVACSFPEIASTHYFSTAILLDEQGKLVGYYRKAHLNDDEKRWLSAGNDIPVWKTKIGNISFIIGDEVRIPDLAILLAMKRVDLILIPTAWKGEYGREVYVDPGLLIQPYPQHTMTFWYNIAKYAQAYTLVANYVGSAAGYRGSSALYALDSVQAHYVPLVADSNQQTAFSVKLTTLGKIDWWINQQYLITGQRVELNVPLTLNYQSPCFKAWREKGVSQDFCWNH